MLDLIQKESTSLRCRHGTSERHWYIPNWRRNNVQTTSF